MEALHRDLASFEVWDKSLERSRRRRVLAAKGRREMARKKKASAAVTAAMAVGPTAPVFAATAGGPAPDVAAASTANRAIAPGVPAELLKMGSTGPEVARVQTSLGIPNDGIFGPQTDAAVRAFQGRSGLKTDGVVGPTTWRALFSGATTGVSAKPKYGFTIQRASKTESAKVRPAIGGKGPVAKIVVRSVPKEEPQTRDVSNVSTPEPSSPA